MQWRLLQLLIGAALLTTMVVVASTPSSCTEADFPHEYAPSHRIFGPGMAEDPFAASSPAACRAACCALGNACQAYYWVYTQVSGPDCRYGQGYAVGLPRSLANATSFCDRTHPEWSCDHSMTARSRTALPPVPERPRPHIGIRPCRRRPERRCSRRPMRRMRC
eukprot:SAG11_NODE_3480_length_2422_cov_11.569522_2_plen_164_part_00